VRRYCELGGPDEDWRAFSAMGFPFLSFVVVERDSEGTPSRLRDATDEIRFQLGQSDRFRTGLIRSGARETHIR